MQTFLTIPVGGYAMPASENGGKKRERGFPVRIKEPLYRDVSRVARVMGKPIAEVIEELIAAPLASRKGKLSAELATLEKMERAEAELATKARAKVKGES